jgi:hypothetical protein
VTLLAWSEVRAPNAECPYTHVVADSPFGRLLLTWRGWKEYDCPTLDESPWGATGYAGGDVEEAKRNVEAEFARRLALCSTADMTSGGAP